MGLDGDSKMETNLTGYAKAMAGKHDEFIKYDNDKPMMSLLEPDFIEGMAKVLTMGAKKYSKDNWKLCEDKSRYEDALYRHMNEYLKGREFDTESELPHLAHVAVNAMFLQYFIDEGFRK